LRALVATWAPSRLPHSPTTTPGLPPPRHSYMVLNCPSKAHCGSMFEEVR